MHLNNKKQSKVTKEYKGNVAGKEKQQQAEGWRSQAVSIVLNCNWSEFLVKKWRLSD